MRILFAHRSQWNECKAKGMAAVLCDKDGVIFAWFETIAALDRFLSKVYKGSIDIESAEVLDFRGVEIKGMSEIPKQLQENVLPLPALLQLNAGTVDPICRDCLHESSDHFYIAVHYGFQEVHNGKCGVCNWEKEGPEPINSYRELLERADKLPRKGGE